MGSELKKLKKNLNKKQGLCRTREQAKQRWDERPKKVEFPSLELFCIRGGIPLLQVVWSHEPQCLGMRQSAF